MNAANQWEPFRGFDERGAADAQCLQLQNDGVPCKVETRALERGIEAQYWVLVPKSLAHRARWITAQLPPTDEELTFLGLANSLGKTEC